MKSHPYPPLICIIFYPIEAISRVCFLYSIFASPIEAINRVCSLYSIETMAIYASSSKSPLLQRQQLGFSRIQVFIWKITEREIIVRDLNRFHHFKNGLVVITGNLKKTGETIFKNRFQLIVICEPIYSWYRKTLGGKRFQLCLRRLSRNKESFFISAMDTAYRSHVDRTEIL